MWVTWSATPVLPFQTTNTEIHRYTQHSTLPVRVQLHPLHMVNLFFRMTGPWLCHSIRTTLLLLQLHLSLVRARRRGPCHVTRSKSKKQAFPWSTTQKQTLYLFFILQPACRQWQLIITDHKKAKQPAEKIRTGDTIDSYLFEVPFALPKRVGDKIIWAACDAVECFADFWHVWMLFNLLAILTYLQSQW